MTTAVPGPATTVIAESSPPARSPHAQAPATGAGQLVTAAATVKKIDEATGMMTLEDPQGNTFDVKIGPNVDLRPIHVGDSVTATYYQEVAVAFDRASHGAPKTTRTTVVRGGVTERQATVTARVVSVDPKSGTVVVSGPEGGTHTLKVSDPGLQAQLAEVEPGEDLEVSYTQAVALSLEPRRRAARPHPRPHK
jgi:hypothetical protein